MSNASLKFKTLWSSFFQSQNSFLIQKSTRHVNENVNDNSNDDKLKTTLKRNIQTSSLIADTFNDYRKRRENNNLSVRKSRAKSRVKIQECASRVQELKDENLKLNVTLGNLQSELFTLKELFQQCFSFNLNNSSVKPNNIPTSTLQKIIAANKSKFIQPQMVSTLMTSPLPLSNASPMTCSSEGGCLSRSDDEKSPASFSQTDLFYINQIKTALNSFAYNEQADENDDLLEDEDSRASSTPYSINLDHDYLMKMQ